MESSLLVTILLLLVATGGSSCSRQQTVLTPEDRVLQAWLTCEECTNGELNAVVKLGQPAVARLGASLRSGPPQATLDEYRRNLASTYQRTVEYAKSHPNAPLPMSERDYIDRHIENFVNVYQERAATALSAVGGPDAKNELTQALSLPLRPRVAAAVREALTKAR